MHPRYEIAFKIGTLLKRSKHITNIIHLNRVHVIDPENSEASGLYLSYGGEQSSGENGVRTFSLGIELLSTEKAGVHSLEERTEKIEEVMALAENLPGIESVQYAETQFEVSDAGKLTTATLIYDVTYRWEPEPPLEDIDIEDLETLVATSSGEALSKVEFEETRL